MLAARMRDLAEFDKGPWRIRLYPAGRFLTELRFRRGKVPSGAGKRTEFSDLAERSAALDRRAAELVAAGWVDTGLGHGRRGRPAPKPAVDAERAFAALVARTVAALRRSKSAAGDDKAWRAAIEAYGKLKRASGGNATEHLTHFFAVDGVALERAHPVVLQTVEASSARKARWLQCLKDAR
jgi:hypothetical protein